MTKVSIAVPTGALMPGALRLLSRAGLARLSAELLGRQLMVERSGVRVILVRPADVPAYVDHGAADLGIVGKDILWESPGAHYELLDLRFGGCRMVLAVPEASEFNGPETWPPQLRVATKYPRTAIDAGLPRSCDSSCSSCTSPSSRNCSIRKISG